VRGRREGDPVLLRYRWLGRVFSAVPARVAANGDGVTALWVAPGTPVRRPRSRTPMAALARGGWRPEPGSWEPPGVLMVHPHGASHSLWHLYDDEGRFRRWYGNLERPWERTELGWDTRDHILDVWTEPGGSWQWKDEDEFAEARGLGLFDDEEAEAVRREGERVMRETELPTGWEDWRPDPAWPPAPLPGGWDAA
jgi:hypothetical protein